MSYEFLEVVLHDPVEPHQLAVDVVDHLNLGGQPHEIKRSTAGEHLHIALMRRAVPQLPDLPVEVPRTEPKLISLF